MYSIEGLENGIKNCKKNIQTFEKAIDKERAQIDGYRDMIEVLKDKKREKEALDKVVESVNADPSRFLQ